ncbi:hypothetical protein AAFM71_19070 [Chromobacterium violaceum]|uniref:hypothetical protein n=1 Tax=Chromobacterium violaceum TaxID=536 RepID=UPI00385D29E7
MLEQVRLVRACSVFIKILFIFSGQWFDLLSGMIYVVGFMFDRDFLYFCHPDSSFFLCSCRVKGKGFAVFGFPVISFLFCQEK